jgi:hypothetical protein
MHETIPLQVLDPFTGLFEVSHTFSAHGSNARIVVWVNERPVAGTSNRGQAMRGAVALCDSPHEA